MGVSKDKILISLVFSRDTLALIDDITRALHISRSNFIRTCVDHCVEDFDFLSTLRRDKEMLHEMMGVLAAHGYKVGKDGKLVRKLDPEDFSGPEINPEGNAPEDWDEDAAEGPDEY